MYLYLQLIINKVQIEIPPDLLQEEENNMVRFPLSSPAAACALAAIIYTCLGTFIFVLVLLQLLVYQLPSYMLVVLPSYLFSGAFIFIFGASDL
jgi:hypothetical protein